MYEYACTVIRVVDGDTLHLHVDLGIDISTNLTVRLAGIDAPELSTPEGKLAKEAAVAWFKAWPAGPLVVRTDKDKREKFGRYLGTIYRHDDTTSLNQWLVDAGHARPYDGGPR